MLKRLSARLRDCRVTSSAHRFILIDRLDRFLLNFVSNKLTPWHFPYNRRGPGALRTQPAAEDTSKTPTRTKRLVTVGAGFALSYAARGEPVEEGWAAPFPR